MYSSTFPCHPHQPSHCLPDLHVSLHSFVKAKLRGYLLHETCPELSLPAHLYQILLFKNIVILITIHLLFECKSNQLIWLKSFLSEENCPFLPLIHTTERCNVDKALMKERMNEWELEHIATCLLMHHRVKFQLVK